MVFPVPLCGEGRERIRRPLFPECTRDYVCPKVFQGIVTPGDRALYLFEDRLRVLQVIRACFVASATVVFFRECRFIVLRQGHIQARCIPVRVDRLFLYRRVDRARGGRCGSYL